MHLFSHLIAILFLFLENVFISTVITSLHIYDYTFKRICISLILYNITFIFSKTDFFSLRDLEFHSQKRWQKETKFPQLKLLQSFVKESKATNGYLPTSPSHLLKAIHIFSLYVSRRLYRIPNRK